MEGYTTLPSTATLKPSPFTVSISESKLQTLQDLIRLSPIGPADYNNSSPSTGSKYGIRRDWLINAKKQWEDNFSWRTFEKKLKKYPQYTVPVKGESGETIEIHFIALFSQRQDARPLAFYHGWPSSPFDFLPILDLLTNKYTPETLPYHIIVPSLPGFCFSGSPPIDLDYDMPQAAYLLNNLMIGLGLDGYIAQGGDLGSGISREQAAGCEACKGFHLNMILLPPPANMKELTLEEVEKKAMPNALAFRQSGMAYALEHGTRGGTIGLALQASPVALLCWIGEKMMAWSDSSSQPSLEQILETVSLYWLTDSITRGLYPYRRFASGNEPKINFIEKPLGYSFFPNTYLPCPVSWAKTTANLVQYRRHESGGHFAPWERPRELLEDVEEYVDVAFGKKDSPMMGPKAVEDVSGSGSHARGL
ncbi:epoxide hydrolase-like protein [Dothistroma septosporum NZE10]|uniref:Putative epoxide hydrolase n=2 Tax=Dothistroma septosporum TaxID=64363 RepID=EPOA_DOTSN|nr:RecName: Full=Putative epoxide hydrolase; AltName: Full=Dothistromin biosynthesis protein epoA [Dothistroma septosporum NZE10]Q30DW8.1 RecName: Full=Putative epoxide hydrolase; AltName: Full=Dothistromin biosynthesis protein epoA [Dothistroma septosporum]AAZ95015.1 epoxide hydrolase [Dothistroma septosporum]EME38863.1 epoxide hydrolase-like protein [Dothistroma septosporum NZE10]